MIDQNKLTKIIDRLFIITKFPLSLVESNGSTIYCRPSEDNYFVPNLLTKYYLNDYRSKNIPDFFPYMHITKEGIHTGVIPLGNKQFLLVGPSLSFSVDIKTVAEEYEKYFTADEFSKIYKICINSTKTDSVIFANVLSECYEIVHDKTIDATTILQTNFVSEDLFSSINNEKVSSHRANSVAIDDFRKLEDLLCSAIISGNTNALQDIWEKTSAIVFSNMTETLTSNIYILLPFLTIFRRAALDGGADIIDTFTLYDSILHDISRKDITLDYLSIITRASYRFCALVASSQKYGAYAVPAKKCQRYIQTHIGEKITIRHLSVLCGLSERQICRIFSECFNCGVTQYVHNERIRQAKLMLLSDDYKIIDISQHLGYSSQSHFSKTFTKYTGYTPYEYKSKRNS